LSSGFSLEGDASNHNAVDTQRHNLKPQRFTLCHTSTSFIGKS
jgi:hypothetical protein